MTPPELAALSRIYDDLKVLTDRFHRRNDPEAAVPADHVLNKYALAALEDITERTLIYLESSAPYFTAQEPYRDELGVLLPDDVGRAAYVAELVTDLRILGQNTMNSVSIAPGSTARLSPLFAGTIRRERTDILDIASRLAEFAQREQRAYPVSSVVVPLRPRHIHHSAMES